VTRHW